MLDLRGAAVDVLLLSLAMPLVNISLFIPSHTSNCIQADEINDPKALSTSFLSVSSRLDWPLLLASHGLNFSLGSILRC